MKKRILSLFTILFCLFFILSCSSPEEKKERHYLKALEYIKQDDKKAAIIELRNAIQIDAAYADARYQLGLLYLDEGDPKSAFSELLRVADLDHTNLDANLKAAEFYLISRRKKECRKLVERILQNDPNFVDGLALLANLELIEGNFDAGMEAINKIGSAVETSDRLLNIKGRIYAAQQKWTDAESTFRKAIEVNNENFNNYQILLAIFQSREEIDKAKTLLDQMVVKFPNDPKVHLLLANLFRSQNAMEQAEAELLKVIVVAPETVQYRLILADFYNEISSRDKAESALKQAITAIPNDPDIEATLATLYFEQSQFLESHDLMEKIIAAKPDHKGAKLLQVRFMLKDRKNRESIQALGKFNRDFPKWPDPFFYLGLAHFNLGEIELAHKAAAQAIQINNNNDRYHTLMAQILQMQGDFDSSKKEASIALKLNPKNFQAALILSRSLLGSKEFDNAIKLLTDMKKQLPDNPEIMSNLALAYLGARNRENAEKTLTELLKISPDNNRALSLLTALKFQNDLPGSEAFVRKHINISPDSSGFYLLLGDILARQQKNEKALIAFERAQELEPENMQAYVDAGRLLVKMGKKDEAMAKYRAMVEQQPDSIVAHMGIATLLEAEGRNEEAMEQYKKILAIRGDYAPAANNLAWQIASTPNGDLGEALRLAMLAKQAFPEEAHIADTLGLIHYKRKSYSLAIPQFEMALNSRPDDPTISYHLALALVDNDEKNKAIKVLENILENGEEFAEKKTATELLTELRRE